MMVTDNFFAIEACN